MCIFSSHTESETLPINYLWVVIPSNFLAALQTSIFFISLLEFTCAQAPYNMRGFLMGLVCSLLCSTLPVSYAIFVAWLKLWKEYCDFPKPSCEFWFFLFQLLTAVIGLVSLMIVARWYKRRERDEPYRDRQFVEDFYDKYCVQRANLRSP